MNRRAFLHAIGGASMLTAMGDSAEAQSGTRKTRIYRLTFYNLHMGAQQARLNDFISSQMPLFRKVIPGPVGVFNVFLGEHLPGVVTLAGFPSLSEMEASMGKYITDSGFQKGLAALEQDTEPPYDSADTILLEATAYSPEIVPLPEKPKVPRIFELRVYHSPTLRQAGLVHERFSGAEIKIFHRCGIHPILYSRTVAGPNMPNLTYLTPFNSLADREKAWDAFGADAEWVKVRKESIDRGGEIVKDIKISLLRPTAFSPIQ